MPYSTTPASHETSPLIWARRIDGRSDGRERDSGAWSRHFLPEVVQANTICWTSESAVPRQRPRCLED